MGTFFEICIIIAVQGVGETVLMLLSNVLDIKGEGVGSMVGTFWKFWYKTLVFRALKC